MAKVPLWARALLLADRAALSAARVAALLRTELLLAGADAATREAITAAVFSAEDTYAPGGPTYEQGLFAWERAALAHASVPARGRVLLGGAGGGRELRALAAMGYEVVAFEPADGLIDALAAVAREVGATALQGSYRDLTRAAARSGPLAALSGTRFDLVVLGWASFAHLTDEGDRRALFSTLRALATDAPVLLSYLGPDDDPRWNGRVAALRAPVRAALYALSGRRVREGEGFEPGAGFYRRSTPDEVESLAREAGYAVALHEREPYPHAILTPSRR